MHPSEGELRASLDGALDPAAEQRLQVHLGSCPACQERQFELRALAQAASARLGSLAPSTGSFASPTAARRRFQQYTQDKENRSMWKRLFNLRTRPAWAALAVIALLATALAFPSVRAAANSFLGLFRVQQVAVVSVNPGNLPKQLGSSSTLESLFTENVTVEEQGELQSAASPDEAAALAGFTLRLPASLGEPSSLEVSPAGKAVFNIDPARLQAVLDEIGRSDLRIPPGLEGASVSVEIPRGVSAMFGECQYDAEAARAAGYDPDDQQTPRLPKCTTLAVIPSPTVTAPPGLDVAQIGQVFLQVMGLSQEEAAAFAKNVDWTTTLVVPIPRYGTAHEDITVDGVQGTLILSESDERPDQYLLVWVKDGLIYALTGPGERLTALEIVASIR